MGDLPIFFSFGEYHQFYPLFMKGINNSRAEKFTDYSEFYGRIDFWTLIKISRMITYVIWFS